MQFPGELKSTASGNARRIAFVETALSPGEVASLTSLFPDTVWEPMGAAWPERLGPNTEILIVEADGASAFEVEKAVAFLKTCPAGLNVLLAVRHASVPVSRMLTRAGAADVVPLPASEAAWALAIERLFSDAGSGREAIGKAGQVVALLKAGGGVGATSLGVQAAYLLAAKAGPGQKICFADLDLQFGAAALHFDLNEVVTVTDCVAVGELLQETQFATALGVHKSGIRVLAAPRDATALEALTPTLTAGLISGLRRDFALTIVDLPAVWTAWTSRAIQLADRVVMVTKLSVPHVHLARRQLDILSRQNLERLPLTLVCNSVTGDQQNLLSIKTAEGALGRSFDIIIPEDTRAMGEATNQGLPLSQVRKGTKLEKLIGELAVHIAMDSFVVPQAKR